MPDNVSVRQALNDAAFVLSEAGIGPARHEARLLLEHALGRPFGSAERLTGPEWNRFFSLIGQRATREPLQHVMGVMFFRYLTLRCRPGVFVVRPETEWVAEAGIAAARDWVNRGVAPRVLDLGSGSGALGLALASEVPQVRLTSVDVSSAAVVLTRENAALVEVSATVLQADATDAPALRLTLAEAGLADASPVKASTTGASEVAETGAVPVLQDSEFSPSFEVVVTNPPYVIDPVTQLEAQRDPELALYGGGPDGLDLPRKFLDTAATLLVPGGTLVMEHGETQGEALVAAALAAGFRTATTGRDLAGRPRYLHAVRSGLNPALAPGGSDTSKSVPAT